MIPPLLVDRPARKEHRSVLKENCPAVPVDGKEWQWFLRRSDLFTDVILVALVKKYN